MRPAATRSPGRKLTVATTAVGAIGSDDPGWWSSLPAMASASAAGTAGAAHSSGAAKSAARDDGRAAAGRGGGVSAARSELSAGRGARFGFGDEMLSLVEF